MGLEWCHLPFFWFGNTVRRAGLPQDNATIRNNAAASLPRKACPWPEERILWGILAKRTRRGTKEEEPQALLIYGGAHCHFYLSITNWTPVDRSSNLSQCSRRLIAAPSPLPRQENRFSLGYSVAFPPFPLSSRLFPHLFSSSSLNFPSFFSS